jgi:hypothetical protein
MATRSFTKTAPTRTFGQFKEPDDAGSYILKKKAKTTFCGANMCTPSITVNTQGNLLLLRKSNALKYYNCADRFNKANLNINLITKLDLQGVTVMNAQDNITGIYTFLNYYIDPSGTLFGNNPCRINNYVSYMVYNPPNSFPVPNPPLEPIVPYPPVPIPNPDIPNPDIPNPDNSN